jgi:hypothetical protein
MSFTFSLSGNSSILSSDFNPPIYLDDDSDYVIGLSNFETFNVIPNIDETNNKLQYGNTTLTIPTGAYEITDLNDYIQMNIQTPNEINIIPNRNTSTVRIDTNVDIDFTSDNSIGRLLGFHKRVLKANEINISDSPVQIIKVNAICIDCNIAVGSYSNGQPVHIIHQFFPTVASGYKIVETPQNILYFPVSVKTINTISVKVLDQDGKIVNFREEIITVRLHLKKLS